MQMVNTIGLKLGLLLQVRRIEMHMSLSLLVMLLRLFAQYTTTIIVTNQVNLVDTHDLIDRVGGRHGLDHLIDRRRRHGCLVMVQQQSRAVATSIVVVVVGIRVMMRRRRVVVVVAVVVACCRSGGGFVTECIAVHAH